RRRVAVPVRVHLHLGRERLHPLTGAAHRPPVKTPRAWAQIGLAVLVAAAFATLVGLGTWQLQRLSWKEALIEAANERPNAAPVAAPGPELWPSLSMDDWNYRRVTLTGEYGAGEAHAWTVLSEPKSGTASGTGYFIVAPFTTDAGWTVLVNRGFVPQPAKDRSARQGSEPPAGTVTIEAIVRPDDPPNFVTPEPNLERNEWFSREIGPMSEFLGVLTATAPYSVDLVASETPPAGLPQAGESQIRFSNNHLQYALTWYGLAAGLVGVVLFALLKRRAAKPPSAETGPA
ncbi:MAG: SURF1 family protein, partial [Pseudomonadota bacterium]